MGNPPKPPEMAAPEPGDALHALVRAAASEAGETSRLPPVERWNPPYCGDIGLAIRRDGVWLYQNSPIGRTAIVKLFARVLRKDEDGRTYLVTPAEKVDVAVEDAPFLAVELAVTGEGAAQLLTFRTNVDDVVCVSPENPLRFEVEASSGGLKPYVRVRGRLDALVTRAVYAELAALAVPHTGREDREVSPDQLGLWSGGVWWPLA